MLQRASYIKTIHWHSSSLFDWLDLNLEIRGSDAAFRVSLHLIGSAFIYYTCTCSRHQQVHFEIFWFKPTFTAAPREKMGKGVEKLNV